MNERKEGEDGRMLLISWIKGRRHRLVAYTYPVHSHKLYVCELNEHATTIQLDQYCWALIS